MRDIGENGEYTMIYDGFWVGTKDKDGKIHISPDLHYRSINQFVDGIAIACQEINKRESMKWGLIDTEGNHLSEFKYNFVEPWGEGYYKCEIGTKKNLLRQDGSEVLKEWFHDVYKVYNGVFIIGNTIRKTKDHPTLYPRGLANVNGEILFPPIFSKLGWSDVETKNFLYGELDGIPYIVTRSGELIDPVNEIFSEEDGNFVYNGPKDTVCDGCIFTDGINLKGEGCGKLPMNEFRNTVIRGECPHYKQNETDESYQEHWDKYDDTKAKEKEAKINDNYAIMLVMNFIQDKLDGDISRLERFDFETLRDDERYGDCKGFHSVLKRQRS